VDDAPADAFAVSSAQAGGDAHFLEQPQLMPPPPDDDYTAGWSSSTQH
jgi:hypothetical protein